MTSNNKQVTISNTDRGDNSAFKVPGDEPGEAPFDLELNDAQHYRWYVHIENGWDTAVDVTVEGSHSQDAATNDTLDAPVTDGSTETVSSGSNDAFDGTTGHSLLQVDVNPSADPTSGDLVITFQRRK